MVFKKHCVFFSLIILMIMPLTANVSLSKANPDSISDKKYFENQSENAYIVPVFFSRKKAKDADDEAALKRQKELQEKRESALAEIESRKAEEEAAVLAAQKAAEEEERLRLEREEAERLEKERLEKERLEAERLEGERQEAEKQAQLEKQMALALEKEKNKISEGRNKKEYLSDYILPDDEEFDDFEDVPAIITNPDEADSADCTLLMKASRLGNEWQIKRLLDSGANVNLKDKNGWTALMYAVRYNEGLECVELLINAGADIKAENKYGLTALALAASYNNNPKILSLLLKSYKSSDREVLRALVFLLSEENISEDSQISKLQILLDTALPLNILFDGKTPLMYAAAYGNSTKVIKMLLDYDASVTLRSTEGKTAFDYASNNKNLAHDDFYWALNTK